jgi:hypothetical protein
MCKSMLDVPISPPPFAVFDIPHLLGAYNTTVVCKVHILTLLLRVGTLWRCDDSFFFEVPPLASDILLIMLYPLLENVL